MKTIINILLLFTLVSINAQINPILENYWKLEMLIIEGEVTLAESDYAGYYVHAHIYGNDESYNFSFDDFHADVFFDDEDQSFTFGWYGFTLGGNHATFAASRFKNPFLFTSEIVDNVSELSFNEPFEYNFVVEEELTYLNIINNVGDFAIFSAATLHNENFDKTQFSIYPNPVSNQLHIESEQTQIEQVEIYNLNGKQVLMVNSFKNQPIDVSSLAKGLHLLKLQTEVGSLTKKLIKE